MQLHVHLNVNARTLYNAENKKYFMQVTLQVNLIRIKPWNQRHENFSQINFCKILTSVQ